MTQIQYILYEDCLKYNHVVSVTSVNHRSEQREKRRSEEEGHKDGEEA